MSSLYYLLSFAVNLNILKKNKVNDLFLKKEQIIHSHTNQREDTMLEKAQL